jgi:hypothetical protein
MNEDTHYLRAISYFLKGLWLFLIGTVVYQFFAGLSVQSQADYLSCLDRSRYSFECSDGSGIWLAIGFLFSLPIFFFAGKAGFHGINVLKGVNIAQQNQINQG